MSASGSEIHINCIFYDNFGNKVINDERLLEVVKNYPILYDKRVARFGAHEYDELTWCDIAKKLNVAYGSVIVDLPFNEKEYYFRWLVLLRNLKKLCRQCEDTKLMESFSPSLQESIHFFKQFCSDEESQVNPVIKLLEENASMMEQLPLEVNRKLETEILDLILEAELEYYAPVKASDVCEKTVADEYTRFLKSISYKEICSPCSVNIRITPDIASMMEYAGSNITADEQLDTNIVVKEEPEIIDQSIEKGVTEPSIVNEPLDVESDSMLYDPLFEMFFGNKRKVPIILAKHFIRPCNVRLKRLKIAQKIDLKIEHSN